MSELLFVFDGGHGGSDPGAVGNGLLEKDLTLKLSTLAAGYLTENYDGCKVLLTRKEDKNLSLDARTDFANKLGADYLCSFHVNAGGGQGFESFTYNGRYSGKAHTNKLRSVIHKEIIEQTDFYDRGKKEANFHMVRESKMPASLLEFGFIDNKHDAAQLKNFNSLLQCARATADGIAAAHDLPKKVKPSQPSDVLYKVIEQHAAYENKASAYELASKLREKGAYVWVEKD